MTTPIPAVRRTYAWSPLRQFSPTLVEQPRLSVASFALTDEVADLLGMPRTTSIRALADALAMQSAEFRVAIAIARSER